MIGETRSPTPQRIPPTIPDVPTQSPTKRRTRRKPLSKSSSSHNNHNLWIHFPKDPKCKICQNCKIQKAQCRAITDRPSSALPDPTAVADSLTADHQIIGDGQQSRLGHKNALVIQDRYTKWTQSYPTTIKTTSEIVQNLQFLGPKTKAKHIYTDGSLEFEAAMKRLHIPHDTSTPNRHETNGVAERAVRRVKEGTSCALVQSGFPLSWWSDAMECFCFLHTIIDLNANGQTPYFLRYKEE